MSQGAARATSNTSTTYSRVSHIGVEYVNVVVHPQPALSAKVDSDHDLVIATVDLGGRITHYRAIRAKPKQRQFSPQELQFEMSWRHVVERFLHNLGEQTGHPSTTAPEAAREFTEAILEAAQTVLPTEGRVPRMPEWCESHETRAAVEEALGKRRGARRLMKSNQQHRKHSEPRAKRYVQQSTKASMLT